MVKKATIVIGFSIQSELSTHKILRSSILHKYRKNNDKIDIRCFIVLSDVSPINRKSYVSSNVNYEFFLFDNFMILLSNTLDRFGRIFYMNFIKIATEYCFLTSIVGSDLLPFYDS